VSARFRFRATLAIATLLVVATSGGLFFGVYRDNLWVSSQLRGQDFVSLVLVLPALLVSARLLERGSEVGRLVWLGVMGYIVYSYLYIFGIAWNPLFLVYLALLTLSAFTLVRALIDLDADSIASRFTQDAPIKAVSRYLLGFGIALGVLWGMQVIAALVTGDTPASVTSAGHPTSVVFILDLGLVVPLFILGARMLRRRQAWGFVLASILLVKGITEGLALLGMSLFMSLANHPDFDVALVPLWACVTGASAYLAVHFFGGIHRQGSGLVGRS